MRRSARRLVAATLGLAALTALPYLLYLVYYALVRPTGPPVDARGGTGDGARQVADTDPGRAADEGLPTVSVVVPTYNEARIIAAKLDDVCGLDYPMDRLEVVLADASDDGTPTAAREFLAERTGPTPDLTVRHDDERRGVAAAVNDAVGAASGEVVLRTDADSKLDPGVLRAAVATLADDSVGVVTGRQTEVLGDSVVESDYRDLLTLVQAVESSLDSTFIVHGPCTAFRRADYVPVPSDSVADDTALALAIRRTGKRVVMHPGMAFVESGVSSFTDRRTRKDRRAVGLLQLLVRNRDMLGRYGAFGRVVLPFNWWFMVVSPLLVAAGVCTATLAGVLLLGPLGLLVPGLLATYVWLGQRDALGPLQAPYAVLDSQVSLLVAGARLLTGAADVTWTVDRDSREAFE